MPPQEVAEGVERATELHGQLSDDIGISEWAALLNEALDYFADPKALNRQQSSSSLPADRPWMPEPVQMISP
jgi:hypothetical protein